MSKEIIKQILEKKKEAIKLAKETHPEELLKEKITGLAPVRPFLKSINKPRVISLIAEIKKASLKQGVLRENFDLSEIARIYRETEVQAISVLTEENFFLGDISFIKQVKEIAPQPILRKDFIFDTYQVYESRMAGADAILLIAEILTKDKLIELITLANQLGMDCLVEAHQEKELKKILNLKLPFIVGINNRDLFTLEVDFKTTEKLYPLIPRERTVVVESGIQNYQDVLFLKILGVNAVLIGAAFMQAQDIRKKIEEIMGW